MADMDIMPYDQPGGGHNRVVTYPMDGTGVFERGEAVLLAATGLVDEAATEPNYAAGHTELVGIAAESAQGIADSRGDGTLASAANQPVGIYPIEHGCRFVTRNLFNGSDTIVTTLALANIGDQCALRRSAAGLWGIDIGGTAAVENFVIEGLLDDNGQDAVLLGTTATAAIFSLMIHIP